MRKVYTAPGPNEAHLFAGLLASEEIAAEVRGEDLFALRGREAPLTEATLPTVWAAAADFERAAALLAEFNDGVDEALLEQSPWTCPECGEVIEAQFSLCWQCGAERSGLVGDG